MYKDILKYPVNNLYLKHRIGNNSYISNAQFCPYEDVLGLGHIKGFSSLLVPGKYGGSGVRDGGSGVRDGGSGVRDGGSGA